MITYLLFLVGESVIDELQAFCFSQVCKINQSGRKEGERKSNNGEMSKKDNGIKSRNSYYDCDSVYVCDKWNLCSLRQSLLGIKV